MKIIYSLRTCSAGAIAVVTAMTIPILLGMGSIGVEIGHWYLGQRVMQGAADASAYSAALQYMADFPTNPNSTTYQTVGQQFANFNGFPSSTSNVNVCVFPVNGGDNCNAIRAVDPRPLVCNPPPCIFVGIAQNTATSSIWQTTRKSVTPTGPIGGVQRIPTPMLLARSMVSFSELEDTTTTAGNDCILALANATDAILVHGNGNLEAACGVAVDGGLTQNVSGTPQGGITFSGANSVIHVNALVVAAQTTGCPGSHCFLYNPSGVPLTPPNALRRSTATTDPYAGMTFPTFPLGVESGGVALSTQPGSGGSGYTNGTVVFTVQGGTGTPAQFKATVTVGKVTAIQVVTDPGAYTVFPSGTITATPNTGGGSGLSLTLTQGCFSWNTTPLPGRTYCSIIPTGILNFPTGNYYIAGGDNTGCVGFCVSGNNQHITSDTAGVTFYLGNGYGPNSRGSSVTANVAMSGFGNTTTLSLCAPGTNCGTGCTGSCLLFVQNPNATVSTAQSTPAGTVNSFGGNGSSVLSGLIYMPKQTFVSTGNSSISGCFGVVAKYVDVGGTPSFTNGCLPGNGIGGTTTTTVVLNNPHLSQ